MEKWILFSWIEFELSGEPGPLSFVLMTVRVTAYVAIAIAQSSATQIAAQPIGTVLVFMCALDEPKFYKIVPG
jgi:hypothetical protein